MTHILKNIGDALIYFFGVEVLPGGFYFLPPELDEILLSKKAKSDPEIIELVKHYYK